MVHAKTQPENRPAKYKTDEDRGGCKPRQDDSISRCVRAQRFVVSHDRLRSFAGFRAKGPDSASTLWQGVSQTCIIRKWPVF